MESSLHWDICLKFGRAGIKNGDYMPFKIVRNDITKMNNRAEIFTSCTKSIYDVLQENISVSSIVSFGLTVQ